MVYHSLVLDEKVQGRDKTLGWLEAVRKGYVYAYGTFIKEDKNFKNKTLIISIALNKGAQGKGKIAEIAIKY